MRQTEEDYLEELTELIETQSIVKMKKFHEKWKDRLIFDDEE